MQGPDSRFRAGATIPRAVIGITMLSSGVHRACAVRSTAMVRLPGVEPNPETVTDRGRRLARLSGRALSYQRSSLVLEIPEDIDVLDGPMRGPCRLVDRTDESLRQGLVVGTLEGNPAVAEHRCRLDLDPHTGAVTATIRTFWRPRSDSILPGAERREVRAYRKMIERLVRALGANPAAGSGIV